MTSGSEAGHTDDETPDAAAEEPERLLRPLLAPSEGVPDVVVDERRLVEAGRAIAEGTGPVAVDAERASGHRYGQRAYLVQLRRAGSGTWLIDPVACPTSVRLADGIAARSGSSTPRLRTCPASRRSGCGRRASSTPSWPADSSASPGWASAPPSSTTSGFAGQGALRRRLVDPTPARALAALRRPRRRGPRRAARRDRRRPGLPGQERVGPRGVRRPGSLRGPAAPGRPVAPNLRYAPGPQAARHRPGPGAVAHPRPHRRTSGHLTGPGPARRGHRRAGQPRAHLGRGDGRGPRLRPARRNAKVWLDAIRRAQNLPENALPPLTLAGTGPPPPRAWPDRDPVAAARLAQAREGLAAFGTEHALPVENLLTPDVLRRVIWSPPTDLSAAGIGAALAALGARPWQVAITAPIVAQACVDHP